MTGSPDLTDPCDGLMKEPRGVLLDPRGVLRGVLRDIDLGLSDANSLVDITGLSSGASLDVIGLIDPPGGILKDSRGLFFIPRCALCIIDFGLSEAGVDDTDSDFSSSRSPNPEATAMLCKTVVEERDLLVFDNGETVTSLL